MRRGFSNSARQAPRPLDQAGLEALALGYVGRYATTRAKLAAYLARKLAERGWAGEDAAPDPRALAERLAGLGYIDDRAFATARGASLTRRGYGARRVADALRVAGIAADDGAEAQSRARDDGLAAALALARRRRLGPFARAVPDRAGLARAIATLMRGGHDLATARRVAMARPGEEVFAEED